MWIAGGETPGQVGAAVFFFFDPEGVELTVRAGRSHQQLNPFGVEEEK
jgi:hypothetical protein